MGGIKNIEEIFQFVFAPLAVVKGKKNKRNQGIKLQLDTARKDDLCRKQNQTHGKRAKSCPFLFKHGGKQRQNHAEETVIHGNKVAENTDSDQRGSEHGKISHTVFRPLQKVQKKQRE